MAKAARSTADETTPDASEKTERVEHKLPARRARVL
jgi:hypothetical protein